MTSTGCSAGGGFSLLGLGLGFGEGFDDMLLKFRRFLEWGVFGLCEWVWFGLEEGV